MPSCCLGLPSETTGGKRSFKSGGAMNVVTMTINVTARRCQCREASRKAHLSENKSDFARHDPDANDVLVAAKPNRCMTGGKYPTMAAMISSPPIVSVIRLAGSGDSAC